LPASGPPLKRRRFVVVVGWWGGSRGLRESRRAGNGNDARTVGRWNVIKRMVADQ
jgi:hypothetical protein